MKLTFKIFAIVSIASFIISLFVVHYSADEIGLNVIISIAIILNYIAISREFS